MAFAAGSIFEANCGYGGQRVFRHYYDVFRSALSASRLFARDHRRKFSSILRSMGVFLCKKDAILPQRTGSLPRTVPATLNARAFEFSLASRTLPAPGIAVPPRWYTTTLRAPGR